MQTETMFRVAFWVLLGGLWIMRMILIPRSPREHERRMPDRASIDREGRALFIGRTIVILFLAAVMVVYALDMPWLKSFAIPLPAWLRWAGFGLGLAGLGLWTWTQAVLGKEYSPQLQLRGEHHLVTNGPYASVRHPMYTAMGCEGIAFALITANWSFVLIAVALIAGFAIRAPREERMMLAAFGNDYIDYMHKTGRFFPKI